MIQVVISEAVMRKSDIGQGPRFISCNFGESIQSFITSKHLLLKHRILTTIDRTPLSISFLEDNVEHLSPAFLSFV